MIMWNIIGLYKYSDFHSILFHSSITEKFHSILSQKHTLSNTILHQFPQTHPNFLNIYAKNF